MNKTTGLDCDMGKEAQQRVRYNAEYFGFIVAFPDGEILLAAPSAMAVLQPQVTKDEIVPHLLPELNVIDGFYLSTPPLVWLELTRQCNLSCPHCYIDGGTPRADEMSSERFHEIIDELADMGVWAVAFTGGEPTLHTDFIELVCHARKRDLLVGIATHGMYLTDELLQSLPKEGVVISVSIDDLHSTEQGKGISTHQGIQAILRARSHGFPVNIMTNTNRENIDELAEMMHWAKNHGVSVRSVPFSPLGRGKKHMELQNVADDVQRAAEFWLCECEWEHEYHKKVGLCVGVIFNYGLSLAYMTKSCSCGRSLCYIAADGAVFPCTMCAGENIFASGSVRDLSFSDVWRDDWEIRWHGWADYESTCDGCVINNDRYYCSARCPAMSHARHGTYFDCGASEFEILSTIYRTSLLDQSEVNKQNSIPVEQAAQDVTKNYI